MEKTEVWKSLDFIGYPNYEVSTLGNVKSLPRNTTKGGIMKPRKNKDGYLQLHLTYNGKQKTFTVHKLVALAFISNPLNLPQINHKDESKENNKVENLEWVSSKENCNYGTIKERKSKSLKGKNKGKHHSEETKQKMSKTKRKPILQYTKEGEFIRDWDSVKSVSIELKLNQGNISCCCSGKLKTCGGFLWKYKE